MMKNWLRRSVAAFLAFVLLFSMVIPVGAVEEDEETPAPPVLALSDLKLTLDPEETHRLMAYTDEKITWESEDEEIATIDANGVVTARQIGETTITATSKSGLEATCKVEVSGILLSDTELEVFAGRPARLTVDAYGDALTGDIVWKSENISIAEVENGRITTYTLGTTKLTARVGKYTATCTITVKEDIAEAIELTMEAGEIYKFSDLLPLIEERAQEMLGTSLHSITGLSVPTDKGILYYGYISPDITGIGVGSETYYINPGSNQRDVHDITFVPRVGFNGLAILAYTGKNDGGASFSGRVRIQITSTNDVAYSTAAGRPLKLDSDDFSAICRAKTGREIDYMTFTLPSPSKGTLYYNYSAGNSYSVPVGTNTRYYRTKAQYIDNISFVSDENFTGTVEIPYVCTTAGGSYKGTFTIAVYSNSLDKEASVEYSVPAGETLKLNAADFQEACLEINDAALEYIYFELPDKRDGTLYYQYVMESYYGDTVTASQRYYRKSNTPLLSDVTFVPARNFSGTVIKFVGYDVNGGKFNGKLIIREGVGEQIVISYKTEVGLPVSFNTHDFNEACQKGQNSSLDWIQFNLPARGQGVLYEGYTTQKGGTELSSRTEVYRQDEPAISDITFVPDDAFTGIVSIPFQGEDTLGQAVRGVVKITVAESTVKEESIVRYSVTAGNCVAFVGEDFNTISKNAFGEPLDFVRFDSSALRWGSLYYQYRAETGRGMAVDAEDAYYAGGIEQIISEVFFVAASDVEGSVRIPFVGYTTTGRRFNGSVELIIVKRQDYPITYKGNCMPIKFAESDFQNACLAATGRTLSRLSFTTLPNQATGKLYSGYNWPLTNGSPVTVQNTYYAKSDPGIHQLVFVPKAGYQGMAVLGYTGWDTIGQSFQGTITIQINPNSCQTIFQDLNGYAWAKPSIEFLRQSGIVSGVAATKFAPSRQITRGEFISMLYRTFHFSWNGSKISFADVPSNSIFAEAIAAAYQNNIARSNDGKFYPNEVITRQSAMAMIVRAMEAVGRPVPAVQTTLLLAFTDGGEVAEYARSAVAALIQMGVVQGNEARKILPGSPITRAEMAAIFHRVLTV